MNKLYRKLYDKTVYRTLTLYENWILPDMANGGFLNTSRMTLKQAKLREFREKKKLLNPYERDMIISAANQEEQIRL